MENNKESKFTKFLNEKLDKKDLEELKICLITIAVGTVLAGGGMICDMNGVFDDVANAFEDFSEDLLNGDEYYYDDIDPEYIDYENEDYYSYALIK